MIRLNNPNVLDNFIHYTRMRAGLNGQGKIIQNRAPESVRKLRAQMKRLSRHIKRVKVETYNFRGQKTVLDVTKRENKINAYA